MSSRHARSRENAQAANSIKAIFQKYDADGNGIICRSEMRDVLTNLGIKQQYMNPLMNAIDVNGDGLIDYKEFVEWILHEGDGADEIRDRMRTTNRAPELQEQLPEDEYLAQMRMASSTGFATSSDPHRTFQSASAAAGSMKRSFQKFDADGNGKIDRSEMRDVLTNLGISQRLMNTLMDEIDVNRDGKIDYNEFCDWVAYEGDETDESRDRMRADTRASGQRATASRERKEAKSTKPRIPGTKFDDSQFHEQGQRIVYVEVEDPHRRRDERVEYREYDSTAPIPGTKFQNPHRRQGERVEYIEYEPEASLGATFQGSIPGTKFQNPHRRQDPRMQTTYQSDFRGQR